MPFQTGKDLEQQWEPVFKVKWCQARDVWNTFKYGKTWEDRLKNQYSSCWPELLSNGKVNFAMGIQLGCDCLIMVGWIVCSWHLQLSSNALLIRKSVIGYWEEFLERQEILWSVIMPMLFQWISLPFLSRKRVSLALPSFLQSLEETQTGCTSHSEKMWVGTNNHKHLKDKFSTASNSLPPSAGWIILLSLLWGGGLQWKKMWRHTEFIETCDVSCYVFAIQLG